MFDYDWRVIEFDVYIVFLYEDSTSHYDHLWPW
jgi:hypothetical protein